MRQSLCAFLVVLLSSITAFGQQVEQLECKDIRTGDAYIVGTAGKGRLLVSLLRDKSLDGTSSWTQSSQYPLAQPKVLERKPYYICINNRWHKQHREIVLIGGELSTEKIVGANELPEILNRPLTGAIADRSSEVRIAQMQQQVIRSLSDCKPDQKVLVCVSVAKLSDPVIRLHNWASKSSADKAFKLIGQQCGCELRKFEVGKQSGEYIAHFKGDFLYSAEFSRLHDAEPRFGVTPLFYLGNRFSHSTGSTLGAKFLTVSEAN